MSLPKKQSPRIDSLTGLRGALALWVVMFHITIGFIYSHFPAEERFGRDASYILLSGFMAVDVFFLLSGFIMCYVYENDLKQAQGERPALHFYALRLARIYPVHLAVMLSYLAVKMCGVHFIVETCNWPLVLSHSVCDRFSAHGFIEQLLLVSSWSWNSRSGWNTPAWSINSEWFMYLLFPPLLVPWIAQPRSSWSNIALGMLALAVMMLALQEGGVLYHVLKPDEGGLVRVTGCFTCGCFMYQFYRSEMYRRMNWPWIGTGCLALILYLCTVDLLPLTVPLFAALLLTLAQPKGWLSRALAVRGMIWLGKISYSLYMVHLLVMELMGLVMKHLPATPPEQMSALEALGGMSFLTIFSILAATVLYYAIEEPARKRLHVAADRYFGYAR